MSSLSNQLSSLNIENMKMKNGLTMGNNLKREARRLMKCIQDEIDNYYDSYSPKQYVRSFRFQEALYAEDFINVDVIKNTLFINLKFNEALSYHDSYSGKDMYVPLLINDGWCWDNYNGEEDHFRRYDGYHFLEKGIEKFNSTNTLGITVTLDKTWDGKHYQSSYYR